MARLFYLPTWLLVLIISPILASSQLQIPLEIGETNEQLENDIKSLFETVNQVNNIIGCYSFIAYTGNVYLNPSLEQRLMEHLAVPIYTVGSSKGSVNHPYKNAENMVITLFRGLDDPILNALNDTELANDRNFYSFLYVPGDKKNQNLTKDDIWKFFSWCFKVNIDRVLLHFRGESEFEVWTYLYLKNFTVTRLTKDTSLENMLRNLGYTFTVQVANDLPAIFWYNSTEQADVIVGGNISLNGPIGILIVEFMRYINASMDILLIEQKQNSNFGILQAPIDPRVDMVANLVANDSLVFGSVVMDTQICLLVPRRRKIPQSRYFKTVIGPRINLLTLPTVLLVFVIKYIAPRRRSLVDSFFSTLRFNLGMPLPAGQLNRLPLADKIIEVYSLLFMAIVISACGSLLSSAFTAGLYYPPITDVESMRASGLRIITENPTIKQAFMENIMPSSLADLVDLVDNHTVFKNIHNLNDSVVSVALTTHWKGLRLYQERLKVKRLEIAGSKLCSNVRQLRLPISPRSPLRFSFNQFSYRVAESGLEQKWLRMSFQKFRQVYNITKLPIDRDNEWQPLTLSFYQGFIIFYMCGMLLSTIFFVVELLYKRYSG
ncbi:hypothetical protein KR054_003249 [Drosophila jambulina]|nr:hypothetical protein KR054_003249 [Drosophila jambulina]